MVAVASIATGTVLAWARKGRKSRSTEDVDGLLEWRNVRRQRRYSIISSSSINGDGKGGVDEKKKRGERENEGRDEKRGMGRESGFGFGGCLVGWWMQKICVVGSSSERGVHFWSLSLILTR